MSTQAACRFRSGDTCVRAGRFSYAGYVDGGGRPMPRLGEMTIQLRSGERFPPVGKPGTPCWWVLMEADDQGEERVQRFVAEREPRP